MTESRDDPTPEFASVGLDADWIASALSDGEATPEVGFAGFIGTGQMSQNARYRLSWKDPTGRPASVVVKVPSTDENTRATAFAHGTYRKECEFYRTVLPHVAVTTPAVHAVHYDEPAGDFAIVLEDLDQSTQGDHFTEPTAEQLHAAIEQLAALQAPVWNATDGPEFETYRTATIDEQAAALQMLTEMCLPVVFDRLGRGLDAPVLEFLKGYADLVPAWARRALVPRTLVHGDFRPDNFMFGIGPEAPSLAVVDWQTLALGAGPADLAYLLGGSLTAQRRRSIESTALDDYVAALRRRGVEYDIDECRVDYAIGSLHGVLIAVAATVMADVTERGDSLFILMLNRHVSHALELDAPGLLVG